jgi:hypothetical protein
MRMSLRSSSLFTRWWRRSTDTLRMWCVLPTSPHVTPRLALYPLHPSYTEMCVCARAFHAGALGVPCCCRAQCELDIMFNLEKAHFILDEMVMNGCIIETNKNNVLAPVQRA